MKTIYVRTSTSRQDLTSQTDICKSVAGNDAIIYQDSATSGKSDTRAGINRLLEDARAGKVSGVYIAELSRIGRSLGFTMRVVEELHSLKVPVILAKTNTVLDPSTLEGKALLGALALAADIEHSLILERSARGRARMVEKGSKPGRKRKPIDGQALRDLAGAGRSASQIARGVGVSKATVLRRLKLLGITLQKARYVEENRTGPISANNEPHEEP
jgi:DNA invertase Pin-like site-specific DNA recombinase